MVPGTRSISSSASQVEQAVAALSLRAAPISTTIRAKYLGKSPARHPYKDTLLELDDIMGRLVDALGRSGRSRTR